MYMYVVNVMCMFSVHVHVYDIVESIVLYS